MLCGIEYHPPFGLLVVPAVRAERPRLRPTLVLGLACSSCGLRLGGALRLWAGGGVLIFICLVQPHLPVTLEQCPFPPSLG